MGLFLATCSYFAFGIFCWRVVWRFILRLRIGSETPTEVNDTCASWVTGIVDILFLRRLFRVNKGLWIGEWMFHVSFVLVFLRHLRYVLQPGGGGLGFIQPFGVAAGYALPFSLLYILLYRLVVERGRYVSAQNLFLTAMILLTGATGVLLRGYFGADVIQVKYFMLRLFALAPVDPPADRFFAVHFMSAIVFLPFVPAHIFAAPLSLFEARQREEAREGLLHD